MAMAMAMRSGVATLALLAASPARATVGLYWDVDRSGAVVTPPGVVRGDRGRTCPTTEKCACARARRVTRSTRAMSRTPRGGDARRVHAPRTATGYTDKPAARARLGLRTAAQVVRRQQRQRHQHL